MKKKWEWISDFVPHFTGPGISIYVEINDWAYDYLSKMGLR